LIGQGSSPALGSGRGRGGGGRSGGSLWKTVVEIYIHGKERFANPLGGGVFHGIGVGQGRPNGKPINSNEKVDQKEEKRRQRNWCGRKSDQV